MGGESPPHMSSYSTAYSHAAYDCDTWHARCHPPLVPFGTSTPSPCFFEKYEIMIVSEFDEI